MSSIRQTRFDGGELSPFLWGRTDLDVHARGARTLKNFLVSRHGVAFSRPGMEFIQNSRDSFPPRLVPFIAGDATTDAYLVEFGHTYLRFFQAGVQVAELTGQPYTLNDVPLLQ